MSKRTWFIHNCEPNTDGYKRKNLNSYKPNYGNVVGYEAEFVKTDKEQREFYLKQKKKSPNKSAKT